MLVNNYMINKYQEALFYELSFILLIFLLRFTLSKPYEANPNDYFANKSELVYTKFIL